MKKVTFAILAGVALGVVGCVSNVAQPKPGSLPGYRDRVERRFDRPLNDVFEASKRELNTYGNITAESAFSTPPQPKGRGVQPDDRRFREPAFCPRFEVNPWPCGRDFQPQFLHPIPQDV